MSGADHLAAGRAWPGLASGMPSGGHDVGRVRRSAMRRDETLRVRALAEMTVGAELEVRTPVAFDEQAFLAHMGEWRQKWIHNPGLRAAIRVAGRMDEAEAKRAPLVRALWLMSRSDEWRRMPGGKMPIMDDAFVDMVYGDTQTENEDMLV